MKIKFQPALISGDGIESLALPRKGASAELCGAQGPAALSPVNVPSSPGAPWTHPCCQGLAVKLQGFHTLSAGCLITIGQGFSWFE